MKQFKKPIVYVIIACVVLAVIASNEIANGILGFFLTGTLPWINIALPAWMMVTMYVALMISVGMIFVESISKDIKASTKKTRKNRMPRRRYSHI